MIAPVIEYTPANAEFPSEPDDVALRINVSCRYPTYIRGEAYLAAREGRQAAAEFQKILDHSGLVWNCWTGAFGREVPFLKRVQQKNNYLRGA